MKKRSASGKGKASKRTAPETGGAGKKKKATRVKRKPIMRFSREG